MEQGESGIFPRHLAMGTCIGHGDMLGKETVRYFLTHGLWYVELGDSWIFPNKMYFAEGTWGSETVGYFPLGWVYMGP